MPEIPWSYCPDNSMAILPMVILLFIIYGIVVAGIIVITWRANGQPGRARDE